MEAPSDIFLKKNIYDVFLKKLRSRQQLTDKIHPLLPAQIRNVILKYIEYNKIIDLGDQELLYSNRYYIYINHFIRFLNNISLVGDEYYQLEYILDESTNRINLDNPKILDVIKNIYVNRQKAYELQSDYFNVIAHGDPVPSHFTVPDNLIICYLTPITYTLAEQNDVYMDIFKKCYLSNVANTPEIVLTYDDVGKHFQFFYPGQKIWDLNLINGEEDLIGYYSIKKNKKNPTRINYKKIQNSLEIFSKPNTNTISLSDFINGKKGVLFVTACRVCGLTKKLNSYNIETICIYETLLQLLNLIISEKLNQKQLNIVSRPVADADFDYFFMKKHENTKTFKFPVIAEGHLPLYDPLLSINYSKSTYKKRRYFSTANPELVASNITRKANNKQIIDIYIKETGKETLLGDTLNRNHIFNAILNAISFKNNSNILKELCFYLIRNKPNLLFKMFEEQKHTIVYYLIESKEYFSYGMFLYLYQLILIKPEDFIDYKIHIELLFSYLTKHIVKLPVLQELVDIMLESQLSVETYTKIVDKFVDKLIYYAGYCIKIEMTNIIANLINFLCPIIASIPEIDKSKLESLGLVVNNKLIVTSYDINKFLKKNHLYDNVDENIYSKISFCMASRPKIISRKKTHTNQTINKRLTYSDSNVPVRKTKITIKQRSAKSANYPSHSIISPPGVGVNLVKRQ